MAIPEHGVARQQVTCAGDGPVNCAEPVPNATVTMVMTISTVKDTALTNNGMAATGVTSAAYTNNDNDTVNTATTLFVIDTGNDQVAIQASANNGTLNPTGKVGPDAGLNTGFDVFSDLSGGRTISNTAFATLLPHGGRHRSTRSTRSPGRRRSSGPSRRSLPSPTSPSRST